MIKKILNTLCTLAFVGFVGPVSADSENAAEIATDQFCGCCSCGVVLGSDCLTTFDARAVYTSSGNVTFQCHFDIPEGYEPDSSIVMESPGCGTPFGFANKTHIVMTPGGKAKLTCQVSPAGD